MCIKSYGGQRAIFLCCLSSLILLLPYFIALPRFLVTTPLLNQSAHLDILRYYTDDDDKTESRLLLLRYLAEKDFYHSLHYDQWPAGAPLLDPIDRSILKEAAKFSAMRPQSNVTEQSEFLRQRDSWHRSGSGSSSSSSSGSSRCFNCPINVLCYNSSVNLWHPSAASGCPALRSYAKENIYLNKKCFNLTALVYGDSRGRGLYVALMKKFYPSWKGLSR